MNENSFILIQISLKCVPRGPISNQIEPSTDSDNGFVRTRRQAIIWTSAAILSNTPWRTYFCEILFTIQRFSSTKMHFKVSPAKMGAILSRRRWVNVSPGALAKKSCQSGKKCRKLKFSGKLLGCPLNTLVKSPQKSQRRNFFYSRWPPSPLVVCCYTIKACKFINTCHKKTIFVCMTMFCNSWNTMESLFQHYS